MTNVSQPYSITFRDSYCHVCDKNTGKCYVSIPQHKNMCVFDQTADYSDFNDPKLEPGPPLEVNVSKQLVPSTLLHHSTDPGDTTPSVENISASSSSEGLNESSSASSWSSLTSQSSSQPSYEGHDGEQEEGEAGTFQVEIQYPSVTKADAALEAQFANSGSYCDKCYHPIISADLGRANACECPEVMMAVDWKTWHKRIVHITPRNINRTIKHCSRGVKMLKPAPNHSKCKDCGICLRAKGQEIACPKDRGYLEILY